MTKKIKHLNQVRIIAGKLRGRKICFPEHSSIRPTADRIRETLFNWLVRIIPDATCLDLFAGSGALGIEALSRGACHVTFIEPHPEAAEAIKTHLSLFKVNHQARVFSFYLPHVIPEAEKKFDVVFLDPPFHKNWIETISHWLEKQNFLAEETYIYIEAERELHPLPIPTNWQIIRNQFAGQVSFFLIKRVESVGI